MHNFTLNKIIIGRSPQEPLDFVFNYCFNAGTIYYINGINGSGKTTLMRTVCGYLPPISGTLLWNGQAMTHIMFGAYYGHQNGLKQKMSVKEYLTYCMRIFDKTHSLNDLISRFKIESFLDIPINYLSCGQQKRVSLVALLCCDRDFYCFDEASSGLDSQFKAILYDYMTVLAEQYQKIIIFSDHNPPQLSAYTTLNMHDFTHKIPVNAYALW
ncbi:MAG: ABC-type transport system involved in cytochrome c biogenesis ATPase subunit [Dasania sp.]|jgi:ABC-type transport system involved in cytochrome c biogenesis ATPase subunit